MRKFLSQIELLDSTRNSSVNYLPLKRLQTRRTIHSPLVALSQLSNWLASAVRQLGPIVKPIRRTRVEYIPRSAPIYVVPIQPQLRKIPTRCIVSQMTMHLLALVYLHATCNLSHGSRTNLLESGSQPPQDKHRARLVTSSIT